MTWLILQALFDYEVDSDDEWEEEDPGESVSSDEVRETFSVEIVEPDYAMSLKTGDTLLQ